MATGGYTQYRSPSASRLGLRASLVVLSGGFIELGLTPEYVGGTPAETRSFRAGLYECTNHLQVAVSGFMIALGIAMVALA